MSTLSDGLVALGKATPGPWEACNPGDYSDYDGDCCVVLGDDRRVAIVLGKDDESKANAKDIASAPDALAWVKKALPYIVYVKGIDLEMLQEDLSPEKKAIIKRELADLDALIAEAKGEGK